MSARATEGASESERTGARHCSKKNTGSSFHCFIFEATLKIGCKPNANEAADLISSEGDEKHSKIATAKSL